MMVNLVRDLRGMVRNQEQAHWERAPRFQQEIRGRVVGLWGYGGIGRETALLFASEGARVTLVAELLGGPKILTKHEVGKLFEARGRYGVKSQNRMEPGKPVVAEDAEHMQGGRDRLNLTRDELIALIEEALRSRGVLT